MPKLKAFTWGYSGWGSESQFFVRAADALETKRGFLPPMFVDLRIARGGRAANFKGVAFADIVGSTRYEWMPKLGNERIKSKRGKPIQIADPSAAKGLLKLIVDEAKKRRRVIMFCACKEPLLKMDDGFPSCHRVEVASLLLKEAKKRDLQIELSEWPGEAAVSIRVKANESQSKALASDARFIPIGSVDARMPAMVALGWGSSIRFDTPDESRSLLVGPAPVGKGQWRLQVISEEGFTEGMTVRERGVALREAGYGPRSTKR